MMGRINFEVPDKIKDAFDNYCKYHKTTMSDRLRLHVQNDLLNEAQRIEIRKAIKEYKELEVAE